jgi:hypothetical protein
LTPTVPIIEISGPDVILSALGLKISDAIYSSRSLLRRTD